ncbi:MULTISPECIES: substrate-binding domain-containing protein [unclassified Caballeronia]|uniref:substrate-binding domain-containing protein n=1 Tax=unclassified Caballeronia TaxID=2646786 RepID=UPI002855FB6A|nr:MULTISPECIES: substrate-binding domain-containing protein [unclassified Caballeronia]MDR5772271.1 substrate-binding domain-containing protein [Caballeronia sp. LZ002]MDR5847706.1 substrate-binding domain-containing protein [Caballeronia sp. LZ003]
MVDVECRAELILRDADGRETSLSAVVPLLKLVSQTGSIANAASAKGLSYRHAWGLLREIEARLGGALIRKSRGRGSVLSELGESVLRAQRVCGDRLETPLQSVASDVANELNRKLASGLAQVRIHASHGYAVATLVHALGEQRVPVDIKYRESYEAVSALARGECELAGFHLPIGPFRATCAESYRPYLDAGKHQLIRLTRRTQGLFVPKGNPKRVTGLRDLARSDVRFVNRQPGSGTRMLLDLSLRGVGVDPDQINGYATTELTHSAIAAFVASGMADLGFGVQPAAQHFALDFIPIIDEDYFFACERSRLNEARLATVLRVLRSDAFNDSVAHLEGYDPARCGSLVDIEEGLRG